MPAVVMSSYPFLAIALNTGSDYGDVLSYADMAERLLPLTHWQYLALCRLSPETKEQILECVRGTERWGMR